MTIPWTDSVAAFDVVLPMLFVKTARYCLPLSAAAAVKEYVVDVAPVMLANVVPPLVLTSHGTLGGGGSATAADGTTAAAPTTVWLSGGVVTVGVNCTVSVAAFDVAVPMLFEKTARNCLPSSAAAAVKEYAV